eukprot:5382793-Amphidinium_carterae.1
MYCLALLLKDKNLQHSFTSITQLSGASEERCKRGRSGKTTSDKTEYLNSILITQRSCAKPSGDRRKVVKQRTSQ